MICLRYDMICRVAFSNDDDIELAFGRGTNRETWRVQNELFIAWLFAMRLPRSNVEAQSLMMEYMGFDEDKSRALLEKLLSFNVLVNAETSSEAHPTAKSLEWDSLGWRDAFDFHESTMDLIFSYGDDEGIEKERLDLKNLINTDGKADEGSLYKDYNDSPCIDLSRSDILINQNSFGKVLHKRRTCRSFDGSVISKLQLSELLEHAAGSSKSIQAPILGLHLLRTSPSGGARHPVEVYPVIFDVEDVPSGLYHYSVRKHCLELINEGYYRDLVWELGHRQRGLRKPAAAFFFTVRWHRHMWKYRYARSYRMALFDVGHMVQTHLLVATSIGLRSFLTPALKDSETRSFLEISDPYEETALYVTSVGN